MTEQQYNDLLNNNPSLREMFQPTINNLDTVKFIKCILDQNKKRTNKEFNDILNNILFLLTRK